ncbi:MAG: hypothetical protein RLY16_1934 [Bacteroidota bacterium]|jgi:hypothetical protein
MSDQLNFAEGGKPTLPSALNVLTILTIIGSALAIIGAFWTFATVDSSYEKMRDAQATMAEAPAFVKSMMGPEMLESMRKQKENKIPVLVITLLGAGLCLFGAIEMRKLKKQGYILWLVGEILPIIATGLFVGFGMMFKGFALIFMSIPIIFLILYTVNKKHLTN